MNYFDYLKTMFSDVSEIADQVDYKKYNNNFDEYVLTFNNGDRFEFISSGRYITMRFSELFGNAHCRYSFVFIYRSVNGEYGLVKTYEAYENLTTGNKHIQGYRPEYTLLEANNIVSKYEFWEDKEYLKYNWEDWGSRYYDELIDKCPTVATLFPNSPDAREILCG